MAGRIARGRKFMTVFPWHQLRFTEHSMAHSNGKKVHFAISQNRASSAGKTIVFMHGVLRNWRSFYPLFEELADQYRLVSLDFRGHGLSEFRPNAYRVIDYVEDAVAIAGSQPGPVVLVGHSLGGMVALATCAILKDHVSSAVLEDPPFSTMGQRLQGTSLHGYFCGVASLLNAAENASKELDGSRRIETIYERFSEMVVGQRPDGTPIRIRDQRDEYARRFAAEAFANLDLSVLAPICECRWMDGYLLEQLVAEIHPRTNIFSLQANQLMGGMLVDRDIDTIRKALAGRYHHFYFEQAGHSIHWQEPKAVAELVRRALQ